MSEDIYNEGGFPTTACDVTPDPNATISNPDDPVCSIVGAQDPDGSVYKQNEVCFCKTLLINRVIALIIQMLNTLQEAGIAQANRVNFLTEWQKNYTTNMSQIHTFTSNNGDAYSDPDKSSQTISDLNTLSSTYSTEQQNWRSVVSDDTKTQQTNVSQTSDAVNSQSSLATSLLQELNSLVSTIFRSS